MTVEDFILVLLGFLGLSAIFGVLIESEQKKIKERIIGEYSIQLCSQHKPKQQKLGITRCPKNKIIRVYCYICNKEVRR